jgi:uncharacterized membrane protein YfcA
MLRDALLRNAPQHEGQFFFGILFLLGLEAYSTGALFFLAAAALLAGLARGFSGFGAALIFMPLATTVITPQLAAPVLLLIDLVLILPFLPPAWPQSDKRDVATIAAGTLIGLPFGTMLLARTEPTTIRWMIVALIVPTLALLASGWRYRNRPVPILTVGVGAISGFLSGIAQVGGPPVAMYWLGGAHKGAAVRANIITFSLASALLAIASYSIAGIFVFALIGLSLLTGPAYGLGLYLGSHAFGLASEATFRRVCYGLIAVAVVIGLPLFDGVLR